MVCDPSDLSLNPPNLGPPPNLGFGPIGVSLDLPFPDISLPPGIPEDILDLLRDLFALIPGGRLVPNADDAFRTIFSAIASLLNQLGPYLALYNFFQALLNMILCILDVICALSNPFKIASAVKRMFKVCIPAFLNLFPFLALIAMILALLLLLLALIEFLINLIRQFIEDLIANILLLAEAVQFNSEQDVLAAIQKIASLICLLEQAFALLIAFQAIFAIIQSLASLPGKSVCAKDENDDCCTDEVCPPFIANNPDGIPGTSGRLIFHKQIDQDVSSFPVPITIPPARVARWQFVDDSINNEFNFNDIITQIDGNIFWPQPLSFPKDSNIKNVPYTVDMRVFVDPVVFGHSSTNGNFTGPRFFRIKDIIVTRQPYIGIFNFENNIDFGDAISNPFVLTTSFGNGAGTLSLIGGSVFEDDEITEFVIDDEQAALDTFIVQDPQVGSPTSEDAEIFTDVSYTFKINHEALMKYQLITVGCLPDIQLESAVVNNSIPSISAVIDRINNLPDIEGALDCLNTSVSKFRSDVSLDSAATLQSELEACLDGLRGETEDIYEAALTDGVSVSNSDVVLDPELQFIDNIIKVTVTLKDAGENIISFNIPNGIQDSIAAKLDGNPSLGNISDFVYDGYNAFVADLTSEEPGNGELQVSFDGVVFNRIINRDSEDEPTAIELRSFPYTFIGSGEEEGQIRRDPTDVANSGGSG